MTGKKALIIGAGPAGLTTAYELLERTDIKPIVFEKSYYMGGISRTVNYKGNRIDIGGHRFFSKSDRVMDWWNNILPVQTDSMIDDEQVMLVRRRKSRIFFSRRFFDYPLRLTPATVANLGFLKTAKIGASYCRSLAFPLYKEDTLEQFFINRFGRELYKTFFKDYTEKVWGVSCNKISAAWGAQRIKGLSVATAIKHFVKGMLPKRSNDITQKKTETTLIGQFLYPKYGPGQMWEEVARRIEEKGGTILTGYNVDRLVSQDNKLIAIKAVNEKTGEQECFEGDYVFSTMPVQDLIRSLEAAVPDHVRGISESLCYRDFITVGLLCDKLKIRDAHDTSSAGVKDNWIYIQEPDVKVGRLQIFNNWSPHMVADSNKVWIGLEYFCDVNDSLWNLSDKQLLTLGVHEMDKLGIVDRDDVKDGTVLRVEKTYPAYFGAYDRFDELREYVDKFDNLFLVGRNGMHRYNNQDHSMLTAMTVVDMIEKGETSKFRVWDVNTEKSYYEQK